MHHSPFEEFQYNSCVSRGICSINPRILALQTVLILFLRIYTRLIANLEISIPIKNFILNTIAITINNPDFNENSFLFAIKNLREELPKIIDKSSEELSTKEKDKLFEILEETTDIVKAIKYGEKMLNRAQKELSQEIRDLFNLFLVISKNLSINLLELESYNKTHPEAFNQILELIGQINITENNSKKLKEEISKAVKIDIELMSLIRNAQEERYGKQTSKEVSYTTVPNKAVLVVGSNLRELENILDALSECDIDVYTHDDMMLAHTFPKFAKYPRLKGQFGFGFENCLLDFATFPGPIILTKNSLHNVENFYRGRLFTTDYTTAPKGVVKIYNNDFSKVIESAYNSKGFKTGKHCESIKIGYEHENITNKILEHLNKKTYKQVFIIGIDGHSLEQKTYFEKLTKLAPENVLIITFSHTIEKENIININTCFDYYAIIRIFEFVLNFNLPITVFIPKCEKNSISQMIYLSNIDKTKVYVGKCLPILLNPSLIKTLFLTFGIKSICTAKKDLEEILQNIV